MDQFSSCEDYKTLCTQNVAGSGVQRAEAVHQRDKVTASVVYAVPMRRTISASANALKEVCVENCTRASDLAIHARLL
jgi:hypothetical protein